MEHSKNEQNHRGKKKTTRITDISSHDFIEHGKIQPQAVDIEEVVLGTIIDRPVPPGIFEILFSDIFYKDSHKRICEVILELYDRSEPIDILSVTNQLRTNGELEMIGGPYYLAMITSQARETVTLEYKIRILHQYWVKRNTITLSSEATKSAFEDISDCFTIVEVLQLGIDEMLKKVFVGSSTDVKDSTKYNLDKINAAMMSKTQNYYETGMKNFDNIVKLTGNNVILVAAKNGSGKTKFIISLMTKLFNKYPKKIGVLWYAMEDGDDKIIRNFVSQRVKLTDEQQLSKGYKLSMEQFQLITDISAEIADYNIEFVNEKSSIKDIGKHFRKFRSQNRDNDLNFLIIDNIMLLKENAEYRNQTAADDAISMEIDSWNVKTGRETDPVVILVHHFTDEQLDKSNLKEAYRPREKHIKGSTRYRDIATMTLLMNRPAQYADLMSSYKGKNDVLKNLFLLDVTKNRNGNVGLVRFFADLGINIFEEF